MTHFYLSETVTLIVGVWIGASIFSAAVLLVVALRTKTEGS